MHTILKYITVSLIALIMFSWLLVSGYLFPYPESSITPLDNHNMVVVVKVWKNGRVVSAEGRMLYPPFNTVEYAKEWVEGKTK